nr:TonB-dependent receptor [Sphingomonas sp.]
MLIAGAIYSPHPAIARDAIISIPATTLDVALVTLARETNVEIVSTEPALRQVRTRGVSGTMPVRKALALLLDGTGFRAISMPGGGYRVVRAAAKIAPRRAVPTAPARPEAQPDIVVTASKQRVPLLRYPGSLTVVERRLPTDSISDGNMSDLARTQPILQSTQLGAGRNKVFIRGVADSSFNGSTQSTVSIYLDDVQLNYSGPDPGLRLYDVKSVEVMEGPQGTLYGAGAIGGVIRLNSNPVALDKVGASIAGGATATKGGSPGFDAAGMINLPIVADRLGLRMVAYRVRDGGYIDDSMRRLSNVNRTDTVGGRAALRWVAGDGWRIDLSGAAQQIDTSDGQYAERAEAPLKRRSSIAQPFSNRLLFGRAVVSKEWDDGLQLTSATGIVGYRSSDQFDATPPPAPGMPRTPATYTSTRRKQLLSQETRLSRSLPNGNSWVGGFTFISDRDILSRSIGSPDAPPNIIGVTNVTKAGSAFGEATFGVLPGLFATFGGRATYARVDGEPSSRPRSENFVKGRSTQRVDPTIALSWTIAPRLAAYARFQTGYRTGGLAVAPGVGRVADYRADSITVGELGIRKLRDGPIGVSLSGGISFARWHGIQADLISARGQPYTANIGDARIATLEGNLDWIPVAGLNLRAAFLLTNNRVTGPIADQSKRDNRRLPETPPFASHIGLSYEWTAGNLSPRIGATVDYVGRSVLGTGDLLDVNQGNYAVLGASAGLQWRNVELSLTVDNAGNNQANRFAFGNPFTLVTRNQLTPLRPLNARLGFAVDW